MEIVSFEEKVIDLKEAVAKAKRWFTDGEFQSLNAILSAAEPRESDVRLVKYLWARYRHESKKSLPEEEVWNNFRKEMNDRAEFKSAQIISLTREELETLRSQKKS